MGGGGGAREEKARQRGGTGAGDGEPPELAAPMGSPAWLGEEEGLAGGVARARGSRSSLAAEGGSSSDEARGAALLERSGDRAAGAGGGRRKGEVEAHRRGRGRSRRGDRALGGSMRWVREREDRAMRGCAAHMERWGAIGSRGTAARVRGAPAGLRMGLRGRLGLQAAGLSLSPSYTLYINKELEERIGEKRRLEEEFGHAVNFLGLAKMSLNQEN